MEQGQFVIIEKNTLDELLAKVNKVYELLLKPEIIHANPYKLYNNKEAAEYLKVCTKTLQNYRDDGLLEFIQQGRKICYTQANLNAFLEKYKNKTFIN
jgi:excisionase family DNA binding protein